MSYERFISTSADQQFRKLVPSVRVQLVDNPFWGSQLKGKFRTFRSLHIKIYNVHSQVVNQGIEPEKKIYVVAAGVRESFYIKLERMKIKSLNVA